MLQIVNKERSDFGINKVRNSQIGIKTCLVICSDLNIESNG